MNSRDGPRAEWLVAENQDAVENELASVQRHRRESATKFLTPTRSGLELVAELLSGVDRDDLHFAFRWIFSICQDHDYVPPGVVFVARPAVVHRKHHSTYVSAAYRCDNLWSSERLRRLSTFIALFFLKCSIANLFLIRVAIL